MKATELMPKQGWRIWLAIVALSAAHFASAADRSADTLAGYAARLISGCERTDGVFRMRQAEGEYTLFRLTPTAAVKVKGHSMRWQVSVAAGDSAVLEIRWQPDEPADLVALWLKNPLGHQVRLSAELGIAGGGSVELGTQELGDELNWYQLTYAVPTSGARWPSVDALLLRLSGLQPQIAYDIYIDEVEAYRKPPLPVTVDIAGSGAEATAGEAINLQVALTPAESREQWPPLHVVVERDGFIVARAALPAPTAAPEAGHSVTCKPVRLELPAYLAEGEYVVRVGGDVQAAPSAGWPKLPVRTSQPMPEIRVETDSGQGNIVYDGQMLTPLLLEAAAAHRLRATAVRQLLVVDATSDCDLYGRSADVWLARDQFDYSDLDRRLSDLLLAHPQALVLLRVYVGSAPWWDAENPDELVKFGDGSAVSPLQVPGCKHTYASWGSEKWRKDAGSALAELVAHVEKLPAARTVVGYLLCSGEWGNWQYPGASRELFCDYGSAQVKAYRRWLRDTYGDLGALRVAWGQPREPLTSAEAIKDGRPILGWNQVEIPTPKQRLEGRLGVLHDPAGDQDLIDHNLFASAVVVETIDRLAEVVKQAAPGKLCGASYGHIFDQARYRYALQNGGHLALGLAMQSDTLDLLTAPAIGLPGESVDLATFGTCEDSASSHRKMLIYEWPTYVHRDYSAEWVRNKVAQALCAGCAATIRPEMWPDELATELERAARIAAGADRTSVAEIAVIVDDVSVAYTVCGNALTGPLLDQQRRALTLLGAPVDVWLLDDVLTGRAPVYKMYVFLNAFYLTDADREALRAELARSNATAVYVYAAGAIDRTIGGRTAKQLTGITLVRLRGAGLLQVTLPQGSYGAGSSIEPRFACYYSGVDVMAPLHGTQQGGLAALRTSDGTVVWSAAPNIPSSILRDLALDAGVHMYADPGNAVYACKELVAIRANKSGRQTIYLPTATDAYDCFSGESVGRNSDEVTLTLQEGDTALLYLGAGPPDAQ